MPGIAGFQRGYRRLLTPNSKRRIEREKDGLERHLGLNGCRSISIPLGSVPDASRSRDGSEREKTDPVSGRLVGRSRVEFWLQNKKGVRSLARSYKPLIRKWPDVSICIRLPALPSSQVSANQTVWDSRCIHLTRRQRSSAPASARGAIPRR